MRLVISDQLAELKLPLQRKSDPQKSWKQIFSMLQAIIQVSQINYLISSTHSLPKVSFPASFVMSLWSLPLQLEIKQRHAAFTQGTVLCYISASSCTTDLPLKTRLNFFSKIMYESVLSQLPNILQVTKAARLVRKASTGNKTTCVESWRMGKPKKDAEQNRENEHRRAEGRYR